MVINSIRVSHVDQTAITIVYLIKSVCCLGEVGSRAGMGENQTWKEGSTNTLNSVLLNINKTQ